MRSLYQVLKASKLNPVSAPDMFTALWAKNISGGGSVPTEHEYTGTVPTPITANGEPLISWTIYGDMQQSGTPTPDSPIYPLEVSNKSANLYSFPYTLTLSLTGSGNNRTVTNTQYIRSNIIELKPNTTYYFSGERANADDNFGRIALFTDKPEIGSVSTHFYSFSNNGNTTFTTDATEKYALVYLAQPSDYQTNYKMMLAESSTPVAYEPYGMYKIPILSGGVTTNVYTAEPLRKIGDYTDYKSESVEYRAVYKLVLDGTENWGTASGNFYLGTVTPDYMRGQNINYAVCSHYQSYPQTSTITNVPDKNISFSYGTTSQRLYVVDSSFNGNSTDFKAYLAEQYAAGTPVCVWYVLATPTTTTVEGPEIPTSNGEQTFDVDTTLKPSEVYIKYKG